MALRNPDVGRSPEPAQRVSHRQAAELLHCHPSNIAKLVAKGRLTSTGLRGPGVGTLALEEVLALRETRTREQTERQARKTARPVNGPPPGPGDHDWLTTTQVAQRLGVTRQAVSARARRGTIPHTRHGGSIWIRSDHLEVWRNARSTTGTDDIAV